MAHPDLTDQRLNMIDYQLPIFNPIEVNPIIIQKPAEPTPPEPKLYVIMVGDNLTKVAEANNVPLERLWAANPQLTDPDRIDPSQSLRIPLNDEVLQDRPLPERTPTFTQPTVQAKPTVQSIRGNSAGNTYTAGYCTWGVKQRRPQTPNGLGHASQWFARAQAMGLPVGYEARAGAVGQLGNHVVIVESVNGSTMNIWEMNYRQRFDENRRTVSTSGWKFIY